MTRATPKTVHRLKVTLRHVRPPVWRRIEVRSTTKLSELAPTLESTMGWLSEHLHAFDANGDRYGQPDPDWGWGRPVLDERKFALGTVLPKVGSKLRFDYDFGDGWEHDVVVEAIEPVERGVTYPRCTAGRRACPPEDCGGVWGYQELLEALADPKHEHHEERMEWIGGDFDPDDFDIDDTTEVIQSPPPRYGW